MLFNGIEIIDSFSFGCGFMFCMVFDGLFSFLNYLLQKSFEIRKKGSRH